MFVSEILTSTDPAWLLQERFVFLSELQQRGTAGFGNVYLVQTRDGGEWYALKLPRPAEPDQYDFALKMLGREAEVLNQVRHPHLIRLVEDHSQLEFPVPHLLLEYVPGPSLEVYIKEEMPDRLTRCRIAFGVVCGVLALWRHGWQHNDLHPLNVVIDRRAAWPLLIDFGLATRHGDDPSAWRAKFGRLGWVHRDIEAGEPYSRKTERYALARVLEEILGREGDDKLVNLIRSWKDDMGKDSDESSLHDLLVAELLRNLGDAI